MLKIYGVMLLLLMLVSVFPARAEEATPESLPAEAPLETEAPTEAPPSETPIVTEAPTETVLPTEVPPVTEAPVVTEAPLEPTADATTAPTEAPIIVTPDAPTPAPAENRVIVTPNAVDVPLVTNTFIVNSAEDDTADNDDETLDGICETATPGECTLRAAIQEANNTFGSDVIQFNIGTGEQTITLAAPLPAITASLVIDGATQPGYADFPLITISGLSGNTPTVAGLSITGGSVTLRALNIAGMNSAGVTFSGGSGHVVEGSYIQANVDDGIRIQSSPNNRIGGTTNVARNVISGNGNAGVYIGGGGAANNLVVGNIIGLNPNGQLAVPNLNGIEIDAGAVNTRIGGRVIGARNIISGNDDTGIVVREAAIIEGNYIGLDPTGEFDRGNAEFGIRALSTEGSIRIGGTLPGAGNVVSGNDLLGVFIVGGEFPILVQGNRIGTDKDGVSAIGNTRAGVAMSGQFAAGSVVGGTTAAARNIISGNGAGVELFQVVNPLVQGNYIGTNLTGTQAVGNGVGVVFNTVVNNGLVGGALPAMRNIISGNDLGVLFIAETGPNPIPPLLDGSVLQGNYIGLNAAGTAALPNEEYGVELVGVQFQDVRILSNVISGNALAGIDMDDTIGVTLRGNRVGTNPAGTAAIPNEGAGIIISDNSALNIVTGNLVSGNDLHGIVITTASGDNLVTGNLIGTTINGLGDLGNELAGVYVDETASQIIGGSRPGAGNRIAYNETGVYVTDSAVNVRIIGNRIFANDTLGIDLDNPDVPVIPDGLTLNDLNDADGGTVGAPDAGGNDLQNFPVLNAVLPVGTTRTRISGTIQSRPNVAHVVEFYSNARCEANGHGEGANPIGRIRTVTDANGLASFDVTLNVALRAGTRVTAATTAQEVGTSEFSRCLQLGRLLLPRPRLIAPANNAVIPNAAPELRWGAVNGASSYLYQVSTTPSFAPGTVVVSATSATTTVPFVALPDEGVYFWRVAGVNAAGELGVWSAPRRFTVTLP